MDRPSSPPSALHDLALAGDANRLVAYLATQEGKASALDGPDAYGFTPLQLATDRGKQQFSFYYVESNPTATRAEFCTWSRLARSQVTRRWSGS